MANKPKLVVFKPSIVPFDVPMAYCFGLDYGKGDDEIEPFSDDYSAEELGISVNEFQDKIDTVRNFSKGQVLAYVYVSDGTLSRSVDTYFTDRDDCQEACDLINAMAAQ